MRYHTGETERELIRLVPEEMATWAAVVKEAQDAAKALSKEAPKEYAAWARVGSFKIEGSESRINEIAESYAIALNELKKALAAAAPKTWQRYEESRRAVIETSNMLARKVPLEWATLHFSDVY